MTNKAFIDDLKQQEGVRSEQVVNHIRQALGENDIDTRAYSAIMTPNKAAWIVYAALMAPGYRSNAALWVKKTITVFKLKQMRGEVTPVDILQEIFERPEIAQVLDRVVVNLKTGDLYAIGYEGTTDMAHGWTDNLSAKRDNSKRLIQNLIQIDGEYFRYYHRMSAKMN